jgi:hypothetical protein
MPGFEETSATQVFHPDFFEAAGAYRVLRFMDWMATNNSGQVAWADRPQPFSAASSPTSPCRPVGGPASGTAASVRTGS